MSVRELERRLERLKGELAWANGEYAEMVEQDIANVTADLEAAKIDEAVEDARAEVYDQPENPGDAEQWWD